MFKDGYSYPEYSYPSKRHDRKSEYAYMCEDCGKIINGYYMYRVKGHIKCWKCRAKEEKEKREMPVDYLKKYEKDLTIHHKESVFPLDENDIEIPYARAFTKGTYNLMLEYIEILNDLGITSSRIDYLCDSEIRLTYRCSPTTQEFVIQRFKNLTKISLNSIYGVSNYTKFSIKKVIFNNPATIVYWKDGSKTVVKCQPGDTFDEEKGLAMCFTKKALGNKGNYADKFKEAIKGGQNAETN